ncbi:unnamed protein product, partial [Menidia menidia]
MASAPPPPHTMVVFTVLPHQSPLEQVSWPTKGSCRRAARSPSSLVVVIEPSGVEKEDAAPSFFLRG